MRVHPNLFVFKLVALLGTLTGSFQAEGSYNKFERQLKFNLLTRASYNEVSTSINNLFNHRCKLALHNCLFQTQWEHVFADKAPGKPFRNLNQQNGNAQPDSSSGRIQASTLQMTFRLNSNISSYHYCKAFLVSQFCIDDYLKQAPDHAECTVDGDGNAPSEFKRSMYRDECRQYYRHFFQSQVSSAYRAAPLGYNFLIFNFVCILFQFLSALNVIYQTEFF